MVYPAYQSMLGHLRSKTLNDFKEAFAKALEIGEGFAVAAHTCTQSFKTKFENGCEGSILREFDCVVFMFLLFFTGNVL